jgi:hypothetical protein
LGTVQNQKQESVVKPAHSSLAYEPQQIAVFHSPKSDSDIRTLPDMFSGLLHNPENIYFRAGGYGSGPGVPDWIPEFGPGTRAAEALAPLSGFRYLLFSLLTAEAIQELSQGIIRYIRGGSKVHLVHTQTNGQLDLIAKSTREATHLVESFFGDFVASAREAKTYLVDFRYVQNDKIDSLYHQIVERAEISSTEENKQERTAGLTAKASLGKLLSFLGLDVGIDPKLEQKRATGSQVVSSLTAVQKCTLVYELLTKTGQISYLNDWMTPEENPHRFVRFRCKVKTDFADGKSWYRRFRESPTDETTWLPDLPMEFMGTIGKYSIHFVCFGRYFIVSPNFAFVTLMRNRAFDTDGFGSVFDVDHEKREIVLSPIALWGSYV